MMDMGMYGSYGKSADSYYSLHATSHQIPQTGAVQSPELTNPYYPQASISPYANTADIYGPPESGSSGSGVSGTTPPQTYYSTSTGPPALHDDGTAIISSENGLSYTNLDYANYTSSSCSNTDHQSYHHVQHLPTQQLHSSHHSEDYQITHHAVQSTTGNYHHHHHQVSQDDIRYSQSHGIRQEYTQAINYKEEHTDSTGYHSCIQQTAVHGLPSHHHQTHQTMPHVQGHQQQQQQQTQVPTYKWMQVKRNVPKPAGGFYFFLILFSYIQLCNRVDEFIDKNILELRNCSSYTSD